MMGTLERMIVIIIVIIIITIITNNNNAVIFNKLKTVNTNNSFVSLIFTLNKFFI